MDFPFDDAPNTAVITCCHILDHGAPILHVSHDADDGMWQFLCGACHDESEGRIAWQTARLQAATGISKGKFKNLFSKSKIIWADISAYWFFSSFPPSLYVLPRF